MTRCPSLGLAPSALVQLDAACALFSKAAEGFKAEKVLVRTVALSPAKKNLTIAAVMQEIMLKLRERAQSSLQAFKDGRESPLARTATFSDSDRIPEDDELATLGGRTRLVGKGSAAPTRSSSPAVVQSPPTSNHHLLIPFPFEQCMDEQVRPTLLDFPSAFVPSPPPLSQPPAATNYANNMPLRSSSLPDAATFFDFSAAYPSPTISSTGSSAVQTPRSLGLADDALDSSMFLTYFPGLEYGESAGVGALHPPMHLDAQVPEESDAQKNSRSEVTMQSSWQDLIAQFGLY